MSNLTRRRMLAATGALGLTGLVSPTVLARQVNARLVVIGGGFGGATLARFAKRLMPGLDVTLVERDSRYTACPFSNLVIAGLRDLDRQVFGYDQLRAEGIRLVSGEAIAVDSEKREVTLRDASGSLSYDRLVLSPGIDFRWGEPAGYTEESTHLLPHAWRAGSQTETLRQQLRVMPENGTVLISVPRAPFRCPPGPYERASLIADFLAREKPRAKLIILDANDNFSKKPLFLAAWRDRHGDRIEWRGVADDGRVSRVTVAKRTLHTDFDAIRGDVVNVIPPQRAGAIAALAGVTDASGWCPINAIDFESTQVPGVHVIGDATIAAPMPKSAFSANAQAKVCAIQLVRRFSELDIEPTTLANTCYSYLDAQHAISVSGVYHNDDGVLSSVPGAGGTTPLDAPQAWQRQEGRQAADWFRALTAETFG